MSISPEAQALIEDEDNRLKQVIQSLQSQRELARRRLKTESEKAQAFTALIVAARRDVEKQLLASDEAVAHGLRDRKREEIAAIDRLIERPYFARIVLAEDENGKEREIEFRLGTVSNSDCRIIDWRKAPISKLYYEYQAGDLYDEEILGRERRGRVVLRHKLDIESGELKGLSCRFGNFVKTAQGWQEAKGRMRGGRSRKVGELPDVLSLITADQFRAITQDAESAVVIQGIAGSGKTTVALHRLAWLLSPENSALNPADAIILVRSRPLRTYIEQSLPSLEISAVRCLNFDVWIRKLLEPIFLGREKPLGFSADEYPPGVERVLRSNAVFRSLELYVSAQRERLSKHLKQLLKDLPPLAARLEVLLTQDSGSLKLVDELAESLARHAAESWFQAVKTELVNCRKRLTLYREDLLRIFENPKVILERDDTRLLDAALLGETKTFLERERQFGRVGLSEAVLLLLLATTKGELLKRPTGEQKKYKHILLDEVQDFSAADLGLLLNLVENLQGLTLTGDAAQAISASGAFPGWEAIRKYRSLGDSSHFVELTVSHRSSLAIMNLGDHVLGESRTKAGRAGKPPLWFSCSGESEGTKETIGWLLRVSEKYPESVIAVLCESRATARFVYSLLEPTFSAAIQVWDDASHHFQEGVLVMSVEDAKGLEFEHVLIWNPSERAYPRNQLGRNKLYVAITRAEEHLCLVTWDRPSGLLPPLSSPLVRGVVPEPEVADSEPQLLDNLPGDG